ncbi:MAG: type IX secretion system sortase PorU [Flavisolibacter sp.]|nr:type IX secretion system sortase PorU [Flavisolibacter sp.]
MTQTKAQRSYNPGSVLASGNFFRVGVPAAGVYKMDVAFLNSLGITGSIPSSQIRLYGNGGGMLPENNSFQPIDDLEENAILVFDGGDGQLNGSDYVLFYAQGPHHWTKDSLNKQFRHQKNLYSDLSYYYITLGGNGKRISTQVNAPAGAFTVNSFNERFFHELDSVNFLNSGKEWFGEEFSNTPGKTVVRNFNLALPDLVPGQPGSIISSLAARSVNAASSFNVAVNNVSLQQIGITHISTGQYEIFARQAESANVFFPQSNPQITYTYFPGSFNSQGWLNWFEIHARRQLLLPAASQLGFRDWNSVGQGNAEFQVANADAQSQVWDVTNPLHPERMLASFNGSLLRFSNSTSRLREYIAFSSQFLSPVNAGKVANQNLHQSTPKDYLIITHPDFLSQAHRLAQFHQDKSNLATLVVTTDQVFNEFASGIPDPTAIRDFVKMYYDRYGSTWTQKGKYLLLFGKASFDYKQRLKNNTNLVPAYESFSSVDPLSTYTSDDFFGFLEDQEDINSGVIINTLDIGIGRVPSKNLDEARNFIDKVMDYHQPLSFGPWRNNMNFIADDEDFNLHLQDAQVLTSTVATTAPVFNPQKIYLDAFQQEGGSSGGRYPQANVMINNNIFNGTLIWNYSGHGGPQRLAEEVVIDQSIVNKWNNQYRLPLFITATCDFAPYDNPVANSLGENLLVRPKTGAIALMTTTRVVFAYSNRIMNDNYLRIALEPNASGINKSLGEAVMAAKNYTYQTSGDITNNRKFALLGDPAMTLGFPKFSVNATTLNGIDITAVADTVKAADFVTLEGEVKDLNGIVMQNFQGTVFLSLFDKPRAITTLGNDANSLPVSFQDQSDVLFRGKATANNGKFSFKFKVPRDINYQYGNGKISLYAHDAEKDGNGFSRNIIIGGLSSNPGTDNVGPDIKAFLNDEKFVNGSITNSNPILILKLSDSSGINTGSSGIDHDIVATLDNDNNNYLILNNFYESDLDNYQKGTVRFQLPELAPGPHSLKIKAWDVMNNSSEYMLDFTVVEEGNLRIDHVLNYPNPFTTHTAFWFEHNYPGTDLNTKVEIFTVSGKLIKSLTRTINTAGNRSMEVEWDGRDEFGNKIGRGVYIYRLLVRSFDGKTAQKWERLVVL